MMKLRKWELFQKDDMAIRMVSRGANIWDDGAHKSYNDLKMHYLDHYSALPTNTQFVEHGVKVDHTVDIR